MDQTSGWRGAARDVREKAGSVVGKPKVIPLHDLGRVDDAFAAAASFEEFFVLERDHLCDLLTLVTADRSEAEEVAQDAFVAVWEHWDRVQLMENPAGYLYRTAINNFRKRYRRAKLFGRIAASLPPRMSSPPADAAVLLSEALRALTPRQRAALVLTELLGYSAEDAARALGVKVSTIGVLKYRGRTALRQEMEPPDD
jgi:RNA polymerase sigma factor (sigma-70 family)